MNTPTPVCLNIPCPEHCSIDIQLMAVLENTLCHARFAVMTEAEQRACIDWFANRYGSKK